jgi:hypothetical protein
MKPRSAVRAVLLAAAAAAALSLAMAPMAEGSVASRLGLVAFTLVKLGLLGAAATWIFASRARLERGHPARRSWQLLGAGFAGFFLSHLVLGVEQLVRDPLPFPSVADALFIPAQLLLATARTGFLAAYRSSGLFSEKGSRLATAVIGVLAAAVGAVLLVTVARLPVPWLERATDGIYALLDLAVLVPLALLVRLARQLGGEVGRAWYLLLAGFFVLSAADVTMGYLQALGAEPSLLLSQFPFLIAYGLAAAGSRLQLALLVDRASATSP